LRQTLADRRADPDRNDRRDHRQPARLVAAPTVYRECSATLDCVIRNISQSCEKIGDVAEMTVPDEFGHHIIQKDFARRVVCRRSRGDLASC
jgi:hypothetical protein